MKFQAKTSIVKLAQVTVVAGLVSGCGASLGTNSNLGTQSLAVSNSATPASTTMSTTYTPASAKTGAITKAVQAKAHKAVLKLTSVAKPGSTAYKIGPQDVLDISVFKVAELSKSVQVSDAGTINLPLVGEVMAVGRTARDIEHDLTKKWGAKYLQNPQVTVFVKEYNSQRITVEGAVKKPGVFPIRGQMTLLQAIATAQGVDETAGSEVIVFRDQKGKRAAARFDLAAIRSGNAEDPNLQAGDVIVAGKSAVKATFNTILKALRFTSVFALL